MRPIAVFIDPGYAAGLTFLRGSSDGIEADCYQITGVPESWSGRSKLASIVRGLAPLYGAIPLGVMEVGWSRKGRSAQSSAGLALNAGIIAGALDVARWEQVDPTWQNVKGWEAAVGAKLKDCCRGMDAAGPTQDAFDSLGLMLHWERRNTTRRAPAVKEARRAINGIDQIVYRVLTP